MSEKLTAKQAAEQLLYKPEYAADKSADVKEKAAAFAEGYKAFLNAAKTEREAAAASEKLLLEAGYEKFEPKKTYAPGQKIYFVQEHKAVVAATIGRKSFEEFLHRCLQIWLEPEQYYYNILYSSLYP